MLGHLSKVVEPPTGKWVLGCEREEGLSSPAQPSQVNRRERKERSAHLCSSTHLKKPFFHLLSAKKNKFFKQSKKKKK